MCKAKQINLLCEECQQEILSRAGSTFGKKPEPIQMKEQSSNFKFLEPVVTTRGKKSASPFQERDLFAQVNLKAGCKCQIQEESKEASFAMESSGFMLPNPKLKVMDPSYSSDFMITDNQICGVVDGVSEWKKYKINPRKFGEELLKNVLKNRKSRNQLRENLEKESVQILSEAFNQITTSGSSTIIYYFVEKGTLHLTWIGDSQALVLRKDNQSGKYEILYKTQADVFGFNSPKQLIVWPSNAYVQKLQKQDKVLGQTLSDLIEAGQQGKSVKPQDARHYQIEIKPDDLIICGSDGFFDNMSPRQIWQIINKQETINPQQLAELLCKEAWRLSQLQNYSSPFSQEASKYGMKFDGGKKDDCTVVVTKIRSC